MTVVEIENNLHNLVANFDKENFIFELLLAYGIPKSTIKRLQGSDHDKLTSYGELVVRKKLFFKVAANELYTAIDELKSSKDVLKHSPRFIIVTDFQTLLAHDIKTEDSLDIEILNITNHYDFFLLSSEAYNWALSMAYMSNICMSITHYGGAPAPIVFGAGYVDQGTWWKLGFYTSVINLIVWVGIGGVWWKVIGLW